MACATTLPAQILTGKVANPQHQPIDGASVVLQQPDSTFVNAAITDSTGTFRFSEHPGRYRLVVQHLLYQTAMFEGNSPDAGTIVLNPKDYALQEVVVKGERPLVKLEDNRLAYDMPQLTANRLVTNAYEALLQLPGVMEQNGLPTLAGSGGVSLILNGQPSSMTTEQTITLLKSMPASRVERAEVMYSAPPQFHVRGAAINIVLKGYKPGENRLQGEVNGQYAQNDKAGGGGGITLAWLSKQWDADMTYAANSDYSLQSSTFNALHTLAGQTHDIRFADNGEGRSLNHNIRAAAAYKPDSISRVSLDYTGSLTPRSHNFITTQGYIGHSRNDKQSKTQMHNAAAAYSSGFGLDIGADYTYYINESAQDFAGGNNFRSNSHQRIDRWKLHAGQSHDLPKGWSVNYGASFTYVRNHNTQLYDLPEMAGQNTESRIRECTYGLYAGFDKSFGPKWSLSASATVEHYRMESYRKWAAYPAFTLNFLPSPNHIFMLAFSSDKTYPDYWTLSGSVSHLNSYQTAVGNTSLRPYSSYNTGFTYVLKSKYILQMSYNYQPDYFAQMIYMDSQELRAVYNFQNWDYVQALTFTAVAPFRLGTWWNSQLVLNAQWKHDKASHYYDAPFDHKGWAGIGQWANTFTLSRKPDIRLEISAFGQAGGIQGSYDIAPLAKVDAALRYTFANGKAMMQVKGTDLFDTMNFGLKVRNGTQHLDMDIANHARAFTLAFSYRFGGYKEKAEKKVDTSRFGL